MKLLRGKAWEIWSHVVMSDRQRVDTQGAVPDEGLEALVIPVQGLEAGAFAWQHRYHSLFATPRTDQSKTGIVTGLINPKQELL